MPFRAGKVVIGHLFGLNQVVILKHSSLQTDRHWTFECSLGMNITSTTWSDLLKKQNHVLAAKFNELSLQLIGFY